MDAGDVVPADVATRLAVRFGAVVFVPPVLVAGGDSGDGVEPAVSGRRRPLSGLPVNTDVSITTMTGLAGIVMTGGALLVGDYVGSAYPDRSSPDHG